MGEVPGNWPVGGGEVLGKFSEVLGRKSREVLRGLGKSDSLPATQIWSPKVVVAAATESSQVT